MYRFGLIGYPLAHSLSPRLHVAALKTLGLPVEYNLYPFAPGEAFETGFAGLLEQMRKNKLHGLNVTVPHKQSVIPYLHNLTPTAQAVGAVNTILYRGGLLTGANTDAPGFLADLESWLQALESLDEEAALRSALLLGAGGSARAVAYALSQAGWQVTLAARRLEQAQQLADQLNRLQPVQPLDAIGMNAASLALHYQRAPAPLSLLVNTTPVGLLPGIAGNPWPAGMPLPDKTLVYDLVYNPPRTALLQQAQAQGLPVRNGMGMLVEQAALALEHWTGFSVSRQAMQESVAEYILP